MMQNISDYYNFIPNLVSPYVQNEIIGVLLYGAYMISTLVALIWIMTWGIRLGLKLVNSLSVESPSLFRLLKKALVIVVLLAILRTFWPFIGPFFNDNGETTFYVVLSIGLFFVAVFFAIGVLHWVSAAYLAITEDMPLWGHLFIAILAPFMIIVMLWCLVILYIINKDEQQTD